MKFVDWSCYGRCPTCGAQAGRRCMNRSRTRWWRMFVTRPHKGRPGRLDRMTPP